MDEREVETPLTSYQAGLVEFSKLDRATMLNNLANYAQLRNDMTQFLQPFAQQSRVVTRQDIVQFFEDKMRQQESPQ
jgi:hypothetical protein